MLCFVLLACFALSGFDMPCLTSLVLCLSSLPQLSFGLVILHHLPCDAVVMIGRRERWRCVCVFIWGVREERDDDSIAFQSREMDLKA